MIHECIKDLTSEYLDLRLQAIDALKLLGPEDRDAAPVLETALQEARSRGEVLAAQSIAYALGAIWIKDLSDPDLRCRAIEGLKRLGPEVEAVGLLETALREARSTGQRSVAISIVCALGALGPDARRAVPLLVSSLPRIGYTDAQAIGSHMSWFEEECATAEAILRIGGEAMEDELAVRSMLRRALLDHDPYKDYIEYILLLEHPQLMKGCADKIIAVLANLLTDAEETTGRLRAAAAECLGFYGPQAAKVAPALAAALKDQAVSVRTSAARALTVVEPTRIGEALAVLLPLLPDPERTRWYSPGQWEGWLLRYGYGPRLGSEHVPPLLALLRQSVGEAQTPYVCLLAAIGERAVPGLRQELACGSASERAGAARVLGQLGPKARDAFGDLVAVLQDADAEVRYAAADALVRIDGSQATVALPVFLEATERFDPAAFPSEQWGALLDTLSGIGEPAAAALPLIRKSLPVPDVSARAAFALARVAPECATEAVNLLLSLINSVSRDFNHKNLSVVLDCLAALGASREVVPRVEETLFDEEKRPLLYEWEWLFSTLVKMDPTAETRVIARIEADLQSKDRFDDAVGLLNDIAPWVSGWPASLLARLLKDKRAKRHWEAIRDTLAGLGQVAEDGSQC
jgi:HEAT repeat protein